MAPECLHKLPGIADFLRSLVPTNVVTAAADDAHAAGDRVHRPVRGGRDPACRQRRASSCRLFEAIAGAMMVVIGWVLKVAPLGVFALGLTLSAQSGAAALGALAHYIVLVSSLGAVFLLLAYPLALVLAPQDRWPPSPTPYCPRKSWRSPPSPRSPACRRCSPHAAS